MTTFSGTLLICSTQYRITFMDLQRQHCLKKTFKQESLALFVQFYYVNVTIVNNNVKMQQQHREWA